MKKNCIINQPYVYLKSQKEVSQTIDQVLQKGAENLYDKYLVDKWPQYLSEDIIHYCDGIVSQKYIITDKGENKIVLSHKWVPEPEPIPLNIDNQARCSVKTEQKSNSDQQGDNDDLSKSIYSQSSIGISNRQVSNQSQRFGKNLSGNKSSKFKGSQIQTNKKNQMQSSQQMSEENMSKQISRIDSQNEEEEEYQYKLIRTAEESEPPTPDSVTDKHRDNREKKDREKNLKQQLQKKQEEEDQAAKDRQRELQKQLKHKPVTYDTNGDLIFIKQKTTHTFAGQEQIVIPQDGFSLDYKNPNKKIGDIERLPYLKNKDETPQKVNVMNEFMKNKKKDKKQEPPPTLEFHKQPNQVEFLTPQTGVNIIFPNGVKKEGGDIEHKNKMRKEDYSKLIENQPNRPIPQYLQQQQDLLQVPNQADLEKQKLKNKLKSYKDFKKRPQTANSSKYFVPQGLQIQEQDLYIEMMADEPLQIVPSLLQGNQSRISQKSQNNIKNNGITQKDLNQLQNNNQQQIQKKKRPLTSGAQNYIKEYKKKTVGPKGEHEQSYDLGISELRKSKLSQAQVKEDSQEYQDNLARMHNRVSKFDKKLIQDKMWGQAESEVNLAKKKLSATSFAKIKPTSANLNSSKSQRILSGKSNLITRDTSTFSISNSKVIVKPQSGIKYNRNKKQINEVIGEENIQSNKTDYKRIQSAKQ